MNPNSQAENIIYDCQVSFVYIGHTKIATVDGDVYLIGDCNNHSSGAVEVKICNGKFDGFICYNCANKLEFEKVTR